MTKPSVKYHYQII